MEHDKANERRLDRIKLCSCLLNAFLLLHLKRRGEKEPPQQSDQRQDQRQFDECEPGMFALKALFGFGHDPAPTDGFYCYLHGIFFFLFRYIQRDGPCQ
jgi:hypothetical protein